MQAITTQNNFSWKRRRSESRRVFGIPKRSHRRRKEVAENEEPLELGTKDEAHQADRRGHGGPRVGLTLERSPLRAQPDLPEVDSDAARRRRRATQKRHRASLLEGLGRTDGRRPEEDFGGRGPEEEVPAARRRRKDRPVMRQAVENGPV